MTVIRYDKEGRRIWATIRIGHERLVHDGPSAISGNEFVCCGQHGTAPKANVLCEGISWLCCRLCIIENCDVTKAIIKSPKAAEDLVSNPVGHSF